MEHLLCTVYVSYDLLIGSFPSVAHELFTTIHFLLSIYICVVNVNRMIIQN